MADLNINKEDLVEQSKTIQSSLGLFTDNSVYRDYTVDIIGYSKIGEAYYNSRTLRANFIECVQIDTSNLHTIVKTFVDLDNKIIED